MTPIDENKVRQWLQFLTTETVEVLHDIGPPPEEDRGARDAYNLVAQELRDRRARELGEAAKELADAAQDLLESIFRNEQGTSFKLAARITKAIRRIKER